MLVGNPNVGKSTLFNLLTGANQKTMNAPRTTVSFTAGRWKLDLPDAAHASPPPSPSPTSVRLIDLPGTYSLLAQSPDEQVTAEAVAPAIAQAEGRSLQEHHHGGHRHDEHGRDRIRDRGRERGRCHCQDRGAATGCPHCGRATDPETAAEAALAADMDVRGAANGGPRVSHHPERQLAADPATPEAADETGAGKAASAALGSRLPPDLVIAVIDANAPASSLYLVGQLAVLGVPLVVALTMADVARSRGVRVDSAQLQDVLGVPVVEVDPRRGKGGGRLAATVAGALAAPDQPHVEPPQDAMACEVGVGAGNWRTLDQMADPIFDWVAQVISQADLDRPPVPARSDKLDSWLLRWWVGLPVFLAVLWGIFQLTTTVAGPIQDAFEGFITDTVGGWVQAGLGAVGWDGGWFESLMHNGILAGLGVVVSFLPLMAIMFLAIALLEDCGYMARAALVSDRVMRLIGLDGRAMLPLVIGFGCNLPALAATKTLPNARQRLLTGLLVPYASCTARLVIFLFIASVCFPRHAGTVVFLMYLVSVAVIVLVGLTLRKTAFRGVGQEPLILVLPPYQLPRVLPLARSVVLRCRDFALKAGRVILVLTVLVWALLSIPVSGGYSVGDDIPPRDSALGAAAQAIAPVFAPAGFDDWHLTASLMTGFVAKEAAVGTLATTFGMDEPEDPSQPGDLASLVQGALAASSGGHGGAAGLAYMFFCLGYTPCMVTLAEQRRLFGSKPTLSALGLSLVVSWLLAVVVFQVGVLL
jgi:ferrous iron transport protein B